MEEGRQQLDLQETPFKFTKTDFQPTKWLNLIIQLVTMISQGRLQLQEIQETALR
jgi:hypothetical protein